MSGRCLAVKKPWRQFGVELRLGRSFATGQNSCTVACDQAAERPRSDEEERVPRRTCCIRPAVGRIGYASARCDVCHQMGISEATFYVSRKRCADLGVAELRLLRQLTEENARLKRIVADLTLDKQILQKVIKKDLMPARRKAIASWMPEQF